MVGAIMAGVSAATKLLPMLSGKGGGGATAGGGAGGGKGGKMGGSNALLGALSVGKSIIGNIQQKKADAMIPAMEDPEQRALASYAARRKRAFQTGTAQAAQTNALQQNLKTGINNSFKVGGGAKGLNMMTQLFNQAQLGMSKDNLAGETQFAEMENQQKNHMAQRQLELGLLKYNTKQARAQQQKKEGKQITSLALAKAVGVGEVNPYGTGGATSDGTTGATAGTQATVGIE